MASLKDLQNRIKSVKNTQKITKAMQMVAAAKLRKAQEAAEKSRPYSERIYEVIKNLAASMINVGDAPKLLKGNGKSDTFLLVVATADRGLCGGFNTNIVRKANQEIIDLENQGKTVKLYLIGKKGFDQLKRSHNNKIVYNVSLKEDRRIHSGISQKIGSQITKMFENNEFDVCKIIYSEFENVMTQHAISKTIIPASVDLDEVTPSKTSGAKLNGAIYSYEPDEIGILNVLLPRNINTQIFTALLENQAGEMGSKMTAMDNATRNAGDMIDKLTLTFNRTRQAQITSELIEIISGAEAL